MWLPSVVNCTILRFFPSFEALGCSASITVVLSAMVLSKGKVGEGESLWLVIFLHRSIKQLLLRSEREGGCGCGVVGWGKEGGGRAPSPQLLSNPLRLPFAGFNKNGLAKSTINDLQIYSSCVDTGFHIILWGFKLSCMPSRTFFISLSSGLLPSVGWLVVVAGCFSINQWAAGSSSDLRNFLVRLFICKVLWNFTVQCAIYYLQVFSKKIS